jgi:hypothetical protein
VRNFAAHNQLSFREDEKSGKRIATLATSEFKSGVRKEIDAIDLRKAADRLSEIEAALHLFVEGLLPANK